MTILHYLVMLTQQQPKSPKEIIEEILIHTLSEPGTHDVQYLIIEEKVLRRRGAQAPINGMDGGRGNSCRPVRK